MQPMDQRSLLSRCPPPRPPPPPSSLTRWILRDDTRSKLHAMSSSAAAARSVSAAAAAAAAAIDRHHRRMKRRRTSKAGRSRRRRARAGFLAATDRPRCPCHCGSCRRVAFVSRALQRVQPGGLRPPERLCRNQRTLPAHRSVRLRPPSRTAGQCRGGAVPRRASASAPVALLEYLMRVPFRLAALFGRPSPGALRKTAKTARLAAYTAPPAAARAHGYPVVGV